MEPFEPRIPLAVIDAADASLVHTATGLTADRIGSLALVTLSASAPFGPARSVPAPSMSTAISNARRAALRATQTLHARFTAVPLRFDAEPDAVLRATEALRASPARFHRALTDLHQRTGMIIVTHLRALATADPAPSAAPDHPTPTTPAPRGRSYLKARRAAHAARDEGRLDAERDIHRLLSPALRQAVAARVLVEPDRTVELHLLVDRPNLNAAHRALVTACEQHRLAAEIAAGVPPYAFAHGLADLAQSVALAMH